MIWEKIKTDIYYSDGSLRDTVVFSIIESEWKTCKRSLNHKIEQIHKKTYR